MDNPLDGAYVTRDKFDDEHDINISGLDGLENFYALLVAIKKEKKEEKNRADDSSVKITAKVCIYMRHVYVCAWAGGGEVIHHGLEDRVVESRSSPITLPERAYSSL